MSMGKATRALITNMKKNPAVIPLVGCIAGGAAWAGFYLLRLAFRAPDVAWTKNENRHEQYENKQYKFYSQIDHENYKHPRPRF